jgi:hypothetical protein
MNSQWPRSFSPAKRLLVRATVWNTWIHLLGPHRRAPHTTYVTHGLGRACADGICLSGGFCAAVYAQVGTIADQGMLKYHMRDVGVCEECLLAAYSSKLGAGWSDWSYRVEVDLESYVVPAFGSAAGQRSLHVTHPAGTSSGLDLRLADGFAAVGQLQFDVYAPVSTGTWSLVCRMPLRLRTSRPHMSPMPHTAPLITDIPSRCDVRAAEGGPYQRGF